MNMKKYLLSLVLIMAFHFDSFAQDVFQLDFNKASIGKYTKDDLIRDGGEMRWILLGDRAEIIADPKGKSGNVLRVKYPKGTVGPETNGIQFIKNLPPSDEYYLDYYVMFEEGFDFRLGGKLPGLTSGGSTYTGGHHPYNGEGWSARYMWVKKGESLVYFYYVDMKSKYGDIVKLNLNFEPGKWYRLTQRIKLNSDNLANGIMQVWVDGKEVVNNTDVRYRLWGKGMIDSFYFSTFHGGATPEWAPQNDSYALFHSFSVSKTKPSF